MDTNYKTGLDTWTYGDAWCAAGPGFVDLQASPAGFGATPREAVLELRRAAG